jgi:hypothetical protein
MQQIAQKDAGPVRLKSRDLYCHGDVAGAIAVQRSLIEATREGLHPGDYLFLGSMLSISGDFAAAKTLALEAHALWPEEPQFVGIIGICHARLDQWNEAESWLTRAIASTPHNANLHDCITQVYGELDDLDRARAHGEQSLVLKDALTKDRAPAVSLADVPVPPFSRDDPARNVIAFSLFGAQERYCQGALDNAAIAENLYPGWRCRFYCDDTVPGSVRAGLIAAGADVVMMPGSQRLFEGLFWRFHVANDPTVDRYLLRDCDSLLNLRERRAVAAWIDSGTHFHVMRDFFSHSELMLAGMWGGVRGALPALPPLYGPYLDDVAKAANCDQKFLRKAVWPTVRRSVCTHDRLFRVLGAEPFPADAILPQGRHVGENMAAWRAAGFGTMTDQTGDTHARQRRQQFAFALATTSQEAQLLAALLGANLNDAEVHHRHDAPTDIGTVTPESSLVRRFNTDGNRQSVRDFWRGKFAHHLHGPGPLYAETSHVLATAGLIENLALLDASLRVDIVILRRPPELSLQELTNASSTEAGLFPGVIGLDPQCPNRIVEPAPYLASGRLGTCLWYVTEMAARAAYYRMLLRDRPNIHIHWIGLETLKHAPGAPGLLKALGHPAAAVRLPSEINGANAVGADPVILGLVERHPLQARKRATAFIESGRRLGAIV